MKDLTVTKVAYKEAGEGGEVRITSETAFNKKLKDATEAKEELPALIASQTFGFKVAETVDEAVQLAGGSGVGEYENIEVFLGVYNYAATLRQHNAANDLLTGDAFTAQEGVWDMSYAVAEKVERAKMTPEEKAIKSLAQGGIHITPDQLRAALALIQQQAAPAGA
jgi:hypothetical protein